MKNEKALLPIFRELYSKLMSKEFVDVRGSKLVEVIAPRIVLNPRQKYLYFGARNTPKEYVKAEHEWYMSRDLNIKMIGEHASMWKKVCSMNGEVNSNYGYLVFATGNCSQYDYALGQLCNDKYSRRSIIIYNRPSMQLDYHRDGKDDFVCTLGQQFLIRDNRLHCITEMRSCDVIYGLFNDLPWFFYVHSHMLKALKLRKKYKSLKYGDFIFIPNSLHVYERHFDLLKRIIEDWRNY